MERIYCLIELIVKHMSTAELKEDVLLKLDMIVRNISFSQILPKLNRH